MCCRLAFDAAADPILNIILQVARVTWSPNAWQIEHGMQRTADLSPLLQEVLGNPGWVQVT